MFKSVRTHIIFKTIICLIVINAMFALKVNCHCDFTESTSIHIRRKKLQIIQEWRPLFMDLLAFLLPFYLSSFSDISWWTLYLVTSHPSPVPDTPEDPINITSPGKKSKTASSLLKAPVKHQTKWRLLILLTKLLWPNLFGGCCYVITWKKHFQLSNQHHHCQSSSYRHHQTFWGFAPCSPADKTAMRHLEYGSSIQSVDINSNLSPALREDCIWYHPHRHIFVT